MTYELAKQLEEAGFPQGEELYCACLFDLPSEDLRRRETDVVFNCHTKRIGKPTLEELIEACGACEFSLVQEKGLWIASAHVRGGEFNYHIHMDGKEPNTAVARLWLALHK